MKNKIRIVLAQLNFTVGDINANLQKHFAAATKARDELNATVIVFPELSLIGYPAEDLLLRAAFIAEAEAALQKFAAEMKGIYCVVGHPQRSDRGLQNACSLIYEGKILATYAKQRLPNYGVFDEARYFVAGENSCVTLIDGIPVGLVICEDLWKIGPVKEAKALGAQIILSPNASPFEVNKHEQRLSVLAKRALLNHLPVVYVNYVGGQDELIFDGGSMVVNSNGELSQFAGFFTETLCPVDLDLSSHRLQNHAIPLPHSIARIYQALVLSVRDYVEKNHFSHVIVGVSGGIDSALTLAIAVDALGKERVKALIMPSRYTSEASLKDAYELVQALGVDAQTISIEPSYQSFLDCLAPSFQDKKIDLTEENIQARCRAVLLMAFSNKYGYLVLTTGNRSELAMGYCTLYGDMAGGFAVLKDVPKMLVYELSRYRNQQHAVIPQHTIDRAPTAELAPNQKDEDSLPPYAILDKILECYLNQGSSVEEIVAQGFDRQIVTHIVNCLHKSEYKRRQSAIGPRINHKSFGKDWRYPITNGFKG